MTDDYCGTGKAIGSLDLGFGTLYIADDGDPDPHATLYFSENGDPDDVTELPVTWWRDLRRDYGDEALADALDALSRDDDAASHTSTDWDRHSPFICDGCGLTWPASKRTERPDGDYCPECVGETE